MGFPYGLDEDAAFMTTWLELHRLEGIKKLAELSKSFKRPLQQKIKLQDIQSKTNINLQKTSLLINGPGLFDYLYDPYLLISLHNLANKVGKYSWI